MSKKILAIEHDPVVSRLLKHTLTRHGYEVQAASNGLEGLKRARSERPDLIMLDVMLAG
jgi:two-component system alkaline phosphatase synthesis response regulator PhoP